MLNVLLIEDDQIMLKAISNILKKNGYNVISASDGKEAFEMIDNAAYDVVITDLMMPYASGMEMVSRVRNHHSGHNAGIIVISAMGQEDIVTEAFKLGADDYLIKPIMAGELLSRINKLFTGKNPTGNSRNNPVGSFVPDGGVSSGS